MGRYGDRASRSALACWYLGHHPKSQAAQVPHARPRPPSSLLVPSQPYQPVARRDTQHLLCIDLFTFLRALSYTAITVSPPPSPCVSFLLPLPLLISCAPSYYRSLSSSSPFFVGKAPRQLRSGETKICPPPDLQACSVPCVMLLPSCVTVG